MENQNVASLIFFADGVTKEQAEKAIQKLVNQGLVVSATTREYNPQYGEPVWYIP